MTNVYDFFPRGDSCHYWYSTKHDKLSKPVKENEQICSVVSGNLSGDQSGVRSSIHLGAVLF